jgi:uncharacterized protein (TIGR00251 family)
VSPLPFLQSHADGVLLLLKVQPRASRNEVAGLLGNELKLKVTAPPVDAAANEAVVQFIAELLDCPRSCVQLIRGRTSRHKQILLAGLRLETVVETFQRVLK